MLYFAYGSNMDWDQMRERCPSAKFVGVAKLPGHRLAFSRRSKKRRCAVADAIAEADSDVWGVVYDIETPDVDRLDKAEGYSPGRSENAYRREEQNVLLGGEEARPVVAAVYYAVPELKPGLPSKEYMTQILKGARQWKLPSEYIPNVLQKIEVE